MVNFVRCRPNCFSIHWVHELSNVVAITTVRGYSCKTISIRYYVCDLGQYSRAVKPVISDQLCILWIKHEIWHDIYLNPGGHNQVRNHFGSDLWWPWVTFKVKVIVYMSKNMIFRKIKGRTSVIPLFAVILLRESTPNYFLWLFLILQGQKVNFKVKSAKIWHSMETIIATSVIPHFDVFLMEKNICYFFDNPRSSSKSRSRSKKQFQGQKCQKFDFQQLQL